MSKNETLQLFENRKVRTAWDSDTEKWYFSVVDVCGVLTDSDYQTARKYWKVLKGRLKKEGNESVTSKRMDQMQDPELSIEQAVSDYRRLGYSEAWINHRLIGECTHLDFH